MSEADAQCALEGEKLLVALVLFLSRLQPQRRTGLTFVDPSSTAFRALSLTCTTEKALSPAPAPPSLCTSPSRINASTVTPGASKKTAPAGRLCLQFPPVDPTPRDRSPSCPCVSQQPSYIAISGAPLEKLLISWPVQPPIFSNSNFQKHK